MKRGPWKVYAVITAMVMVYHFASIRFDTTLIWLEFAINIVALCGLVMFAFARKFLFKFFWSLFALGYVAWLIYFYGFSPYKAADTEQLFSTLLLLGFYLPMVGALFMYGYGARYIWKMPDTSNDDNENNSGNDNDTDDKNDGGLF